MMNLLNSAMTMMTEGPMMPMKGFVAGAAVAAGVAAGIYLSKKYPNGLEKIKKKSLQDWSELQKKERVIEVLDEHEIAIWMKLNMEKCTSGKKMFLVKATEHWINLLGYKRPEEINPEKNAVIFFGNPETGDVDEICLFSFARMSPMVAESFGNNDYIIVTSEKGK